MNRPTLLVVNCTIVPLYLGHDIGSPRAPVQMRARSALSDSQLPLPG
ncbi:hypothetical protein [Burkholderia sp. JP2-270]|nr:hypothetical protein [Burkholderia sp. JP2-270]